MKPSAIAESIAEEPEVVEEKPRRKGGKGGGGRARKRPAKAGAKS